MNSESVNEQNDPADILAAELAAIIETWAASSPDPDALDRATQRVHQSRYVTAGSTAHRTEGPEL